jgi:hypothetical protein
MIFGIANDNSRRPTDIERTAWRVVRDICHGDRVAARAGACRETSRDRPDDHQGLRWVRQIVGATDGEHAEVAVKHEQGLAHRVHDGLREGPRASSMSLKGSLTL